MKQEPTEPTTNQNKKKKKKNKKKTGRKEISFYRQKNVCSNEKKLY